MTGFLITLAVVIAIIATVVRITHWLENCGQRMDQMIDDALASEATPTEIKADNYWANWTPPGLDVVDAAALPLSNSPAAQRIRADIRDNNLGRLA
jgi:hypothetical protein